MGHEQDRGAVSRTEVRDQLLHLETGQSVKCREGLIEQQQLWFAHQCARERDPLRLSRRECRGPHVGVRRQTDLIERAIAAARVALGPRGPGHVLPYTLGVHQSRLLEDDGARPRYEQLARVRAIETGEKSQQRRLAAPALSEQRHELATADLKIEAIERRVFAELTNQLVSVDGE